MNKNQTVFYRIGGLNVRVNAPAYTDAPNLALFRSAPSDPDVTCTVQTAAMLDCPSRVLDFVDSSRSRSYFLDGDVLTRVFYDNEGSRPLIVDRESDGCHTAQMLDSCGTLFGSSLAVKLMNLPRAVIHCGGIFLHASFIMHEGGAILFTAQKQVGKSTQAALWQQCRGAEIINGDRALIRRLDGVFCACGSPYCGTSGICKNVILPLRAVVILSQGPENRAVRANVRQTMAALLDGCSYDTWDADIMRRATDLCGQIVTEVPFYTLSCRPDEGAVRALEAVLK